MASASDYVELHKLIKASERSSASVFVGEETISMRSGSGKSFVTAHDNGVSIGGKLLFQGLPNQIKIAGITSFAPMPMLFLPIGPTLIPSLPLEIVPLIKLATALGTLLG